MEDMWPSDITHSELLPPVAMMREQASLLGKKTRNLVTAEVSSRKEFESGKGEVLIHRFDLVAPALDNYTYGLFYIVQPITIYPLRFGMDSDIYEEIASSKLRDQVQMSKGAVTVDSEELFREVLRRILQSQKTKWVVSAMLAQTTSEVPPAQLGDAV